MDYLGYQSSQEGIEMDPKKVQAVLQWEVPCTWKQVQSFFWVHPFLPSVHPAFAQIALPIYQPP